ncbi:Methyltransferase type 11 [Candidatus Sulfotelmatomonas gaucii]|uniref:Methyltransferase type 11 n=1 Tax=Candidatus Sulfuritelmatomonas gaucii TaxID=2043161 RepID=A0A2N9LK43_9BACT|nr:Methyltransferase type 11 [Candidatus Sulfotelmatomonas gaucii]
MKNQCRKPDGWLGRWLLRNMNKRHSGVTDWGLSHVAIPRDGAILDVGCGGGRTIAKLAAASGSGMVYGIDHSADSVGMASKLNTKLVNSGRVVIRQGSVSQLPYANDKFDLVTAVETHFFWPDLANDVREVLRVVAPGGMFVMIAEVYKGANAAMSKMVEKYAPKTGMTLLSPDEHRDLLEDADFDEVQVFTDESKGWICVLGSKERLLA